MDIRRGIFQRSSLSPLLFVLIVLPLTLVLGKTCKGHEARQPSTVHGWFEIVWIQQRPTRLTSTSGKDFLARHQDVVWTRQVWGPSNEMRKTSWQQWIRPHDQHIRKVEEESYKYLCILQLDMTRNTKMKHRITSEYVRRVKKLCRSKLNGGNMISGINAWDVCVLR